MITKSPTKIKLHRYYWKAWNISKDGFNIYKCRPQRKIKDRYECEVKNEIWLLTHPFFETSDEAIEYAKQIMDDLTVSKRRD